VVLDRDFFSGTDAAARRTRAALTVVAGKIVYDTGIVRQR
jgi:predicted amidohydrolase YtcJ